MNGDYARFNYGGKFGVISTSKSKSYLMLCLVAENLAENPNKSVGDEHYSLNDKVFFCKILSMVCVEDHSSFFQIQKNYKTKLKCL